MNEREHLIRNYRNEKSSLGIQKTSVGRLGVLALKIVRSIAAVFERWAKP